MPPHQVLGQAEMLAEALAAHPGDPRAMALAFDALLSVYGSARQVEAELARRAGVSGLEEKASRKKNLD